MTEHFLQVDLVDGRSLRVPVERFPRLAGAEPVARDQWRLMDDGRGIHWPLLDEDILVDAVIRGERSKESPASLANRRS